MTIKLGWNSQMMASFFLKEATYNAGVTMSTANAVSLTGFTNGHASWEDNVVNDKDTISGKEFGFDQVIAMKGLKGNITMPRAKPNDLIGLAAMTLGSITSTQDGGLTAYKHRIVPVAVGTAIPSIQIEEKVGGVQQYAYTGVKADTLKISGKAGEFVEIDCGFVGSGSRAESATAFVASLTESWMQVANMKAYLESGANISIDAALTQGAENISSGTPTDIGARLESFEVSFNNALNQNPGFGGGSVLPALDYGRRSIDLKFAMTFLNKTDLDLYLAQTAYAFEVDLKGALIAATGAMYYGVQIIIPRFKLKTAPLPKGGPGDALTCDFDCEVFEDGTNPAIIIEGYNAKAAYLA